MADMQNDEISARTGFLNRIVTCRIAEAGLEILRDSHSARIGYDAFAEIRFDRRGSGRDVLSVKTAEGATTTCASSDNLGHQSVLSFGGSGSSLIEFMRFQFGGASAA